MKTILFVAMATLLYAEVPVHPFEVESGTVLYDISGGTQLTPETNLTIKANAELHFKEWGGIKLEKEDGTVVTTGAITYKQVLKRWEKHTKESVITADYANEQLLERQKSLHDIQGVDETVCLTKTGEERVAGIPCEVWEGAGVKKCIYKNIVLRSESRILGVLYKKEATKAIFDGSGSSEVYDLPDLPVQEFALFKDDIKTKNAHKTETFYNILKEVSFGDSDMNVSDRSCDIRDDERRKFINYISQDIFERQKELLPELLVSLKAARACLQTAEEPFSANQCIDDVSHMKAQLGTEEYGYIMLWDEKQKNMLLDKIEDELINLQARIPCVNRAKNLTDLSGCMK